LIYKTKGGIPYLQFPNLADFSSINHGIFTRNGGKSKPPFASLNISLNVGDDENDVIKNRRIIYKYMNEADLVFAKQVHGNEVSVLNNNNCSCGNSVSLLSGDAIITNMRQKSLVLQLADCQAVLFYDPINKAAANVHCGWSGSVLNIVGKTIIMMNRQFGSNPGDIIAGIGPSLGPCCSEFINYKKEIPESLWNYMRRPFFFDFWEMTHDQMTEAGIKRENIYTSRICTKCNTDSFYSYRNDKQTGRFAAVIVLK